LLSKIAHFLKERAGFGFPTQGFQTHRSVVGQPSNLTFAAGCLRPVFAGFALTLHLRESQAAEIIKMGFTSQQMFSLTEIVRVDSRRGKMSQSLSSIAALQTRPSN